MKISNFNIGTRLAVAFAVMLLLMGGVLTSALWQLHRIDEAKDEMVGAHRKAKLAAAWREGLSANSVRTLAKVKTADPDDERVIDSEMKVVSAQATRVQQELESLVTSAEGKAILKTVAEQRTIYAAVRNDIFKLKAKHGITDDVRTAVTTRLTPEMKKYLDSVDRVAAFQDTLFRDAHTRIDAVYASSRASLIVQGLIAIISGVALALMLTKSITRPLAHAVTLAQEVAAGDLTAEIEVSSKDEVGRLLAALKAMTTSLLTTVTQVRHGTDAIVTASRQIAAGNLDLSARTEQQASSLEETASSMEELTSAVRHNSDSARQANALAHGASEIATRGGIVVSQVVATMASINESSQRIGDIIAVIDGIAFQTNILALNAAVEAARAGEQGRGFAVVASEVRNLAHRSAAAAKEIRMLVTDSVSKVGTGGELVAQAGLTMDEIVAGISRVAHIMSDIAGASAEQTAGIEQINAAIAQMDDVTQQNAALVEQAAAAATSLEDQATSLARLVSVFHIDGNVGPLGTADDPSRARLSSPLGQWRPVRR